MAFLWQDVPILRLLMINRPRLYRFMEHGSLENVMQAK